MDDGIGNRMKEGEPDTKNEGEMRREKRGSANGRSGIPTEERELRASGELDHCSARLGTRQGPSHAGF